MIETTIQAWHDFMKGDRDRLETLIADGCTFYSPVVFTPQRGKEITLQYLRAAEVVLAGEGSDFHYVKETLQGHRAVLEFEVHLDGKYVNGVDLIEVDDSGRIVEFKVMVRPLQAIQALHQMMGAQLARAEST